jgi:hypothetical protein
MSRRRWCPTSSSCEEAKPILTTRLAIAQELEARGVRTPAGRHRWDAKQVSRLLAD